MRVTENMRFVAVQRSLAGLRSRQAELVNQITSGQKLSAPSDDPVAAAQLARASARAARAKDLQATISTVRSDISLSERTLSEASQLMVRARELALSGANGSMSAADRVLLGKEVDALREQLVATANARGTRGFLFSGSQTATAAFSSAGEYQGDAAAHQVEVAPEVLAEVTVTGAEAFTTAGGTDAFAVLTALSSALSSNDTQAISGTLDDLEASRSQITRVQAQAGLIMNRLDAADEALAFTSLELARSQSELAEVDPFSAISELTQLTTTLEQAIAVARTTLDRSGGDLF